MKVPDELVEAIARRRYDALYGPAPGRKAHATRSWDKAHSTTREQFLSNARDDLQAVLPKVRERLCTQGNLANQAAAGTVEATCFPKDHGLGPVAFEGAARMIIEAAFDHAFPEEGS